MDEIEQESMFHSGNPAFKVDQRYDQLMAQMDYYQKELLRRGVTRMQLWEEYIAKNPKGYRFTQICYHIQQRQIASF